MNERIKELANRAMVVREDGWHEFDPNVFAELLIRECVKEIEFQYGGGSDQPMDNEWDRAIECVSSMVKYRFGVQE
jgi:hypothetical protein